MNKTVLIASSTIFSIAGAYIPVLWGDNDLLSGMSILTGTIGGLVGIFVGVLISKRFF